LHCFWSFAIPKLRLRLPPGIEPSLKNAGIDTQKFTAVERFIHRFSPKTIPFSALQGHMSEKSPLHSENAAKNS
jgi:hypothetical protein